jgi:hypothetical protein
MGNVVGATWKGIPYLRYMPDKINQTGATRQSGANMGRASRMGAAFRKSFEPLLPQPKDRTAQNRFTGPEKMTADKTFYFLPKSQWIAFLTECLLELPYMEVKTHCSSPFFPRVAH